MISGLLADKRGVFGSIADVRCRILPELGSGPRGFPAQLRAHLPHRQKVAAGAYLPEVSGKYRYHAGPSCLGI